MLSVGILSDLHLEFDRAQPRVAKLLKGRRRTDPTPVDDDGHPVYGPRLDSLRAADVVLAVGDIDTRTWPLPWLDAASRYTGRPWIYVAGNHEFYDRPIESALRDLRAGCEATAGRVTLLENGRADVHVRDTRVAILGATLWTDYRLLGPDRVQEVMDHCGSGMTDHRVIRCRGGAVRWTPQVAARTHAETRAWLAEALPAAQREADVVLVATHHAPSGRSIPPKRRGDLLSAAYASDLEDLMAGPHAPALWAHGHIHRPVAYRVGGTRVVSAPRGRIGREPSVEAWAPRIVEATGLAPARGVREGWEAAFEKMAAAGDDEPVFPDAGENLR